jgi:hypothetical protein
MAQASALSYGVIEGWEQLPPGWEHRDVAGVAVDGGDRVYLICRGDHPIIVYDSKGNFCAWGSAMPQARRTLTICSRIRGAGTRVLAGLMVCDSISRCSS